jgi:hypothetical protein
MKQLFCRSRATILTAEKMSLGALADGLAVKVKGDTFKRSGIPNSRFEILQQGFVPDNDGGGHCEMQVSEPVMLSTWSASNYCQKFKIYI